MFLVVKMVKRFYFFLFFFSAQFALFFFLPIIDGYGTGLGIYVDDKFAYAGDEEGNVIKTNHSGKVLSRFKLPAGVKAIVGDGQFLYCGTNEGQLFDLTNDVPREMCQIEGFSGTIGSCLGKF
jgi:hypothetical protein